MKPSKKILTVVLLILFTADAMQGQTFSASRRMKTLQFLGYALSQYSQPVLVGSNKYEAMFTNMGEIHKSGSLILDELNKTFTIQFFQGGDSWVCHFTSEETTNKHDSFMGDSQETTYNGMWSDDNKECVMIVTKSSSGCLIRVKSGKVIDSVHGINEWKKIYMFSTRGECF